MTLSTPVRSLLVMCASVAALFALPATTARAECVSPTACMLPSGCPYSGPSVVGYPNGGHSRNLRLHDPTACITPPPPGAAINSFFDVFVDLDIDGNGSYDALTDGLLIIRYSFTDPLGDHYDTEILALNLTGGGLPPGVMIRESPTLQSTGQTTIKPVAGGFHIDSFFDVFTELSLDGGQTWMPGDGPSHVTAAKQGVTAVRASTWGAVKLIYR